jgi:plasmid stability protein
MNITIKGISSSLHRRLLERAERHQRSLNKEVIVTLEAATSPKSVSPRTVIEELKQLRAKIDLSVTMDEIERAIQTGRE